MQKATTPMSRLTIGIDLGDRHSLLCLLDESGSILEEGRLATTPESFRQRFTGTPPARIAIEVGTHLPWISALLAELGHEVVVVHCRTTPHDPATTTPSVPRWLTRQQPQSSA